MAKKIDWDKWRRKYITGMELADIAELQDAPNYGSLRNRSSKEDWPQQRRRFNDNTVTIAASVTPELKDVTEKVDKIIDSAEMLTRHIQAARLVGGKAITRLKTIDPNELSPREALDLLKWAIEAERLTEGLATAKIESDAKIENSGKIQINVIGVEP